MQKLQGNHSITVITLTDADVDWKLCSLPIRAQICKTWSFVSSCGSVCTFDTNPSFEAGPELAPDARLVPDGSDTKGTDGSGFAALQHDNLEHVQ